MIGTGTTATIPYNVYVNSTQTPTGGWDFYEDSIRYAYYQMEPSKIEPLDPRKDPKMWAMWFREFLTTIFCCLREEVAAPVEPILPVRALHRCRSGTMPVREWKRKNWVQALKAS